MKILVAIKRVIDPYAKIRVNKTGSGVETENVKMAMNPFCEIAVEEAVRLREAGVAEEILVVSAGDESCQEQLRTALALGADRAVHIDTSPSPEPLNVARLLCAIMRAEEPGLVILGKQSIDTDNNQVAQMLAALSGSPQGTFASEIQVEDSAEDGSRFVSVTREVDGGLETVRLTLPAIISTDLRLNEPRYASLPNIMKAKRKPLNMITPDELGVAMMQHQEILEVMSPSERPPGVMLESVSELVDKLKNEARVI